MIETEVKAFRDLSIEQLYDIMQLRSEVFVLEQDCAYQDIDGKDKNALHILGIKDTTLVAYARIFRAGDFFEEAGIGRLAVRKSERKSGYGKDIMNAAIEAVHDNFKERAIRVSAQLYLERFYHSLGFEQVAEGYLEDGIPHIGMVRKE